MVLTLIAGTTRNCFITENRNHIFIWTKLNVYMYCWKTSLIIGSVSFMMEKCVCERAYVCVCVQCYLCEYRAHHCSTLLVIWLKLNLFLVCHVSCLWYCLLHRLWGLSNWRLTWHPFLCFANAQKMTSAPVLTHFRYSDIKVKVFSI